MYRVSVPMINRTFARQDREYVAAELKKMGVLLKKKVNPKVDSRKFTKIDIRKNKEINLSTTKQIKLVSLHPEGSYSIEINKFGSKTLKIKDPDAFWKQTRYLVVVFK